MQLILNFSKYLILAVLSGCLLLVLNDSNAPITYFDTDHSNETANITEVNLPQVQRATPAADTLPTVNRDITQPKKTTTKKTVSSETVWKSVQHDLKLDHKAQSPQVKAEIKKLLADQDNLIKILNAASPYIYFIHKQTQALGLPSELALIPVIESEFNPHDHSNKGASGLWQLMPGTAHELGIKIKSGYDGRRNVIDSTKAALAYFNDLGENFNGNWYLAIAAYNCGQALIESKVRHTGSHSFWKLPLPKETQYYVPRLLAVAAIIQNPEKYGIKLPTVSNKPYFTEIKLKKPVTLTQIAKLGHIDVKTLRVLNPDVNNIVVAKNGVYRVLVPVNQADSIKAGLSQQLA